MDESKPVLRVVRGGAGIAWLGHRIRVRIGRSVGGTVPVLAAAFVGRQEVAALEGTIVGGGTTASYSRIMPAEGIEAAAGLRAIGVLVPSVEMVLRKHGVEKVLARTHARFARFMREMGYPGKAIGCTTQWDIDKNIKEKAPELPHALQLKARRKMPVFQRPAPRRKNPGRAIGRIRR